MCQDDYAQAYGGEWQMKSLLKYYKNIFSQSGEDGIIKEILKELKIEKGTFIEFGAWNGIKFSNCFNLLRKGWRGIYIENNKDKFKELVENTKEYNTKNI